MKPPRIQARQGGEFIDSTTPDDPGTVYPMILYPLRLEFIPYSIINTIIF